MPQPRPNLPFASPAAAIVLAAVWLAMLLAGGTGIDRVILINAYVGERTWQQVAVLVTRLGDWEVLVALSLFASALLIFRRNWRLAVLLLGSTLLARLLVGMQKAMLGRIRPAVNEHLVQVQSLSFPSGHAANSMVVYLMLALLLTGDEQSRRLAVGAAMLLSILIGVSRVMVGVHWPSDVVGGWAFGLLWTMAVMRWLRPRFDRPMDKKGQLQ